MASPGAPSRSIRDLLPPTLPIPADGVNPIAVSGTSYVPHPPHWKKAAEAVDCAHFDERRTLESEARYLKRMHPKEEDEGLDEDGAEERGQTFCGACGENYASDEFWICCDICEWGFHGKCVEITPARAEHIKQYKCPSCSDKRGSP